MDGHAFLAEIRGRDPQVPVIVATGHASLDNAIRALRDGASGMLIKPFTAEEFETEVTNALQRARIRHDALQYRLLTPILDGVALALTAAIEARDLETGDHCRQLGTLGERVATMLGLSEQERTTIRIGGYLHDVGKIAIADRILLKPGKLTDEEYAEMQRHAEIGASIVQTHEAMTDIARIVRHHHERFDGAGYPDRLVGEEIPLGRPDHLDRRRVQRDDQRSRLPQGHSRGPGLGGDPPQLGIAVRSGDRRALRDHRRRPMRRRSTVAAAVTPASRAQMPVACGQDRPA